MAYHTSDKEQDEIVKRYKSGESSGSIGDDLGFSRRGVLNVLSRHGVDTRSQKEAQREYAVNHNAFDEVTPESAYWVGFLMADGFVTDTKDGSPFVGVTLAEKDRNHLVNLRDFLESTHPIKEQQGDSYSEGLAYRFGVYSQSLADDLAEYGVLPRKSDDTKVRILDDNRHFWRGVVDGDGYVRHGTGSEARVELVGAKPLLQQYSSFCTARIGSDLSVRPHKSIWRVGCSWGTAEHLLSLLYQDQDVCLDRKSP